MLKKSNEMVEKMEKRKRIALEIARRVGTPACVIFVVVALCMSLLVRQQVLQAKQTELTLESESASHELNAFFQEYLRAVEQLAVSPEVQETMKNAVAGSDIKQVEGFTSVYQNMVGMQKSDADNLMAVWIGDIDANVLTQSDDFTSGADFDITSRAWFEVTKTGEAMLTKPYVDASTGNTIVSAAAPVYDPETGSVLGVTGLDLSLAHVGEILSQCTIGDAGYVMLMSSDGTIVYHPNQDLLQKTLADLNISESVTTALANKESKFVRYKIDGATKYGYITAVGDTGYIVLSSLPSGEYFRSLIMMIATMICLFGIGVAFIFFSIKRVAGAITKPIEHLNTTAQRLAEGELDVTLDISTNDEIGELGDSIRKTVDRLKQYIVYIDEIAKTLASIADGKLSIHLENDYAGEFGKIKDALLNISSSMTEMMKGITETATQVSGGADELALGAQGLAEGATTQAAAVEELVATTDSVMEQVRANQAEAQESASETKKVTKLAETSKQQIGEMLTAMKKINDTSNQVVGIIHTIEEIASQTNLLALNASIEAARAGEAGKGFAVVATEIGSLAGESAKAASNTKELIEISMQEIQNGSAIVDQVTESLQNVVDGIEHVNHMIEKTAEAAVEQAENMEQIRVGIESISQAVQDNSATAQESSATSEELAAQATTLNDMVKKFQIN